MSVQAYSVESFEEFRKTFKKTLELYNPSQVFPDDTGTLHPEMG